MGVRDEATLILEAYVGCSRQLRKIKVTEERDVKPRLLGLLWFHTETDKESYLW